MSDIQYHQALSANRKLVAEIDQLKAENERLRSASFVTAVPSEEYEKLKAENERLRESQLSKDKWTACEQMHFQTADNLRDKLYQACLKIERLEKAGNTVVAAYCMGDWDTEKWKEYPVVAQWLAAKEGRDAK